MRATRDEYGRTRLWLSSRDTWDWAHKPGAFWPCSQLADRRVFAEFEPNGDLVDLAIDGGRGEQDIDSTEFNAMCSDFLRSRFGPDHPAIRS
jgi:hypothetical protein